MMRRAAASWGAPDMSTNVVNLDALIPRDDFAVDDGPQTANPGERIGIAHLDGQFFVSDLRKPDFQRETAQWTPTKVVDLIRSFLDADLIPAVILWRAGRKVREESRRDSPMTEPRSTAPRSRVASLISTVAILLAPGSGPAPGRCRPPVRDLSRDAGCRAVTPPRPARRAARGTNGGSVDGALGVELTLKTSDVAFKAT
jgi:hypothetical protein